MHWVLIVILHTSIFGVDNKTLGSYESYEECMVQKEKVMDQLCFKEQRHQESCTSYFACYQN